MNKAEQERQRAAKVLSVQQPWAALIVSGQKDVENRTWSTPYRGTLYIHSSRYMRRREPNIPSGFHVSDELALLYGYVLGTVELVDIVRNHESLWAEKDCWHWVLADAKPLAEPFAEKGALGLWELPV